MIRPLQLLFALLPVLAGPLHAAEPVYPDLRDSHDAEFQAELDAAFAGNKLFWDGVRKKEFSVVIADVTDLEHPEVAWYNSELMLYAASMPKIAIAIDRHPTAGRAMTSGIKIVDDLMLKRAAAGAP